MSPWVSTSLNRSELATCRVPSPCPVLVGIEQQESWVMAGQGRLPAVVQPKEPWSHGHSASAWRGIQPAGAGGLGALRVEVTQ